MSTQPGAMRSTSCTAAAGVFTLTMHPYIIGRPGRLRMLDRLLDHIQRHPNVQFHRAIDLVDEFAAARPWSGG